MSLRLTVWKSLQGLDKHMPGLHNQADHAGIRHGVGTNLYHGTTKEALAHILAQGIKPTAEIVGLDTYIQRQKASPLADELTDDQIEARGKSVFLSQDRDKALAVATSGQEGEGIVLQVELPPDVETLPDELVPWRAERLEGSIPPAWIKGWAMVTRGMNSQKLDFQPVSKGGRVYYVGVPVESAQTR